MAAFFLDSSAIVKRYLTEVGSAWVQALADSAAGNDLFLVSGVEVAITQGLIARAMSLAERHRLRAYDAVQLGAALELLTIASATGISLTFVSADTQLNLAASTEGLLVENPLNHP